MPEKVITKEDVWELIKSIPDPEVPVITIAELGMLQKVEQDGDAFVIYITPTYTGCPAMKLIEDQIHEKLQANNITHFKIKLVYSPAWTTDWISEEAKEKLRIYGIAPPEKTSIDKGLIINRSKVVACPRCGSKNTQLISQFGSTACKALYKCLDCKEPYEHFKCI